MVPRCVDDRGRQLTRRRHIDLERVARPATAHLPTLARRSLQEQSLEDPSSSSALSASAYRRERLAPRAAPRSWATAPG